jgi:hypothetical protein
MIREATKLIRAPTSIPIPGNPSRTAKNDPKGAPPNANKFIPVKFLTKFTIFPSNVSLLSSDFFIVFIFL